MNTPVTTCRDTEQLRDDPTMRDRFRRVTRKARNMSHQHRRARKGLGRRRFR